MTLNPLKLIKLAASATLAKLGLGIPETKRVTIYDNRQQPTGLASTATVERVHAVMEAADVGSPRDLFALYQEIVLADSHLQGEFAKRKLAMLGDVQCIHPHDADDEDDVAAAEAIEAMICGDGMTDYGVVGWDAALVHLLDGILWPVALVEKVWEAKGSGFRLAELVPVPDQLLDWTTGQLMIRGTSPEGLVNGNLYPVDPARYIMHRGHLLTAPDKRGGPMRCLVWWWLLKTMDREWWVRFLERYGAPFLVGKYDQADDASRSVLMSAFSYATKVGGLVVSNETNVEVVQAGTKDAGEAFNALYEVCNREISKLVVGQTLSAEKASAGLGDGGSGLHGQVREDIRQYDAKTLGTTLSRQLFAQFLRNNGIPGRVPKIIWGGEDGDDSTATATVVKTMHEAGLELTDEALATVGERLGLSFQRVATPAATLPGPGGVLPRKGAPNALSDSPDAPQLMGARVHLLSAASLAEKALRGDLANDAIAAATADELARAFRGAFAPVALAIRESESASDLEARLKLMYADWPAAKLAGILEPALTAYAANGLSVAPTASAAK